MTRQGRHWTGSYIRSIEWWHCPWPWV